MAWKHSSDGNFTCLTIISPDRDDIVLPIPENENPKGLWFTTKEGSHYRLKFTFNVSNNIVFGLNKNVNIPNLHLH